MKFITTCFFLLLIIIVALFFASYQHENYYQESFTPKIRELYRPYIRNTRIMSEGFYNIHKNRAINLFRKFGIM
jgi:hypothetical protein